MAAARLLPHPLPLMACKRPGTFCICACHPHAGVTGAVGCAQSNVDGAYFGTTFPHLLLMTYPGLRPPRQQETYVPRVFGFRLHNPNKQDGAQGPDSTSSEPMQHSVQVPPPRSSPCGIAPPALWQAPSRSLDERAPLVTHVCCQLCDSTCHWCSTRGTGEHLG